VRAPQNKRATPEMIREIVFEILQAPRVEEQGAESSTPPVGEAEEVKIYMDVLGAIKIFQELNREVPVSGKLKGRTSVWGHRTKNLEDFKSIKKQVDRLSKALIGISGTALVHLFSDERNVHLDQVPTMDVLKRTNERMSVFGAILRDLYKRCEYLLEQKPGEHGSSDYLGRWVAREAWRILRRAKRNPASGINSSVYGAVAMLLYEAITGEADKDLQRACKAALAAAAKGELTVDGPDL
jgi:hypothetical protein